MRVDGDRLHVAYTVYNGTDARVTITDRLSRSGRIDPREIVVRAADDPDTVAFTRAFVEPPRGVKPRFYPSPHGRDVAPGAELRGSAVVALPLGAQLNYASTYPLVGPRTHAILELGYYSDPAIDASNAHRAPRAGARGFMLLRGAKQPLPDGVSIASPNEQIERTSHRVIAAP